MKDRLEELRQLAREAEEQQRQGEDEDDDVPITPEAVVFEEEPVLDMFLIEVQRIRDAIVELEAEVQGFSQQQKHLVAAMRRFSMMKKDSSITRDIKLRAESIHKRLEALNRQVKSAEADNGPAASTVRMQRAQHTALFRHFQQVMLQYNNTLVCKQDKCKQFIIRQLEVSGQEVSEEQVEEMMAQGQWEVFNENVLHESNITRAQLSEIEQRHKELLNLESNMKDLRDLFLEMFVMVEEQGEHIENVQAQVEKTQDYVKVTTEKFKMAARYKPKSTLKRLCCCCCNWKKLLLP
ncbi:hypothetical protein GJAV_G00206250 [Gymnothorax javanicus]|nr:hypothetical protein GJAV_G00206250 [Gymnothorax javanicus]